MQHAICLIDNLKRRVENLVEPASKRSKTAAATDEKDWTVAVSELVKKANHEGALDIRSKLTILLEETNASIENFKAQEQQSGLAYGGNDAVKCWDCAKTFDPNDKYGGVCDFCEEKPDEKTGLCVECKRECENEDCGTEWICSDHYSYCGFCDNTYCKDCMSSCERCGDDACRNGCLISCGNMQICTGCEENCGKGLYR